ncbi:MAG: LysR family transcriptional regulator [Lautropia sp.]
MADLRPMPDKHLDIYLLRCLSALIAESHVTKAAERMGLTQPAMSAILRRLRAIFNDPLLVRTEKGMVSTERARELASSLHVAVDMIDLALASADSFDPATASLSFEIAASESVAYMLMPRLIAHVRSMAPGVQLRIRIPDLPRARQMLEEAEIDLLLSFTESAPEGLRSSLLWTQRYLAIGADAHPLPDRRVLSLDDFLAWPHACHRLRNGGSATEAAVESALRRVGRDRSVGVWLPSAIAVPAVVSRTDFLAVVPEGIARAFAPALALRVYEPPLPLRAAHLRMYWHDRMHRSPGHTWLRGAFRDVVASLTEAERRPANRAAAAQAARAQAAGRRSPSNA